MTMARPVPMPAPPGKGSRSRSWLRRGQGPRRLEPKMAITEQQILDALAQVRDPEKGGDIVSLGMVSGLVVRDGNVGFAIEVEPERGPRLEPLRKAAEQAVEALPDVVSVTAVLTAENKPAGARAAAGPQPAAPGHGAAAAQPLAPGVRA